jgi:hypothetical protein
MSMTQTIPTSTLAIMALRHEHDGGCHSLLGNGPNPDCPLCLPAEEMKRLREFGAALFDDHETSTGDA